MSLGLKKFEDQITKAWKSVLDDKDETDWALFSYHQQSNDLMVVASGKYGLDELQQELNNPGKVLYAFAKVLNPKSNLPIFITINWVGEGAPLNRKSNSPKHSYELQNFLKYSSLCINAREDEEIEPDAILDKIRKSSTTEFNFSLMKQDESLDKPTPVSTNHVRIRPERDLNLKEKKKFWSKLDQQENEKKLEEIKKQKELKLNELNLISNRLKQKNELNSTTTNDEQMMKKLDDLKLNNEILTERERFWEQQKQEEKKRRDEENRRRLQEKRNIENEIRSLSDAKQIMNAFNTFNNSSSNTTQVKKINAIDEINLEKKKVLNSIKNSLTNNDKENTEVNRQNEIQEDDDSIHQLDDLNDEIVIHGDDENESLMFTKEIIQNDLPETESYYKLQDEFCANRNSISHMDYLKDQNRIKEEEVYLDEEYENEYYLNNFLDNGVSCTSYLSKRLSNEPLEDILEEDEGEELDDQMDQIELLKGKGLCAKALFDYQASDETEISFKPNTIITNIEKVYTTWWIGRINDKSGLFPSNFVQVLETTELN